MRRLIEPSHLDLCCLQMPIIIACGSERVNNAGFKHEPVSLNLSRGTAVPKPFFVFFQFKYDDTVFFFFFK